MIRDWHVPCMRTRQLFRLSKSEHYNAQLYSFSQFASSQLTATDTSLAWKLGSESKS